MRNIDARKLRAGQRIFARVGLDQPNGYSMTGYAMRVDTSSGAPLTRYDVVHALGGEPDLSSCPYYQGKGTCQSGCHSEPSCQTGEPLEAWRSVRQANRKLARLDRTMRRHSMKDGTR